MKRLVALLLFAVAGCGSTAGGGSPSPIISAAAVPSPSPAALSCRLPIASGDAPVGGPSGGGVTGHGGFVTLPSGAFTVDPQSSGGYDHQLSRWLPTPYRAISPDGSRYVYAEPALANPGGPPMVDVVHIISVATATDHMVAIPGPVIVVAWTATGVYVEAIVPQSDAPPSGLTLIDPDALTFHQITASGFWQVVGDKFAYGADVDPADPSPPPQNGPGPVPGDRIEKLSLESGTVTPLLTINGTRVFPEGLDADQIPIIGANTASGFTVRLASASVPLFTGASMDISTGDADPTSALADSTGIWFTSFAGVIWHFGPGDTTAHQVGATGIGSAGLAGPCT